MQPDCREHIRHERGSKVNSSSVQIHLCSTYVELHFHSLDWALQTLHVSFTVGQVLLRQAIYNAIFLPSTTGWRKGNCPIFPSTQSMMMVEFLPQHYCVLLAGSMGSLPHQRNTLITAGDYSHRQWSGGKKNGQAGCWLPSVQPACQYSCWTSRIEIHLRPALQSD